MRIIDISVGVSPATPVWPGDPAPVFDLAASIDRGDAYNLTRIHLSAHTGTHIDAPSHFIAGGKATDATPLETLIGPCMVVDFSSRASVRNIPASDGEPSIMVDISAGDLENAGIPAGASRLLIRTDAADARGDGATERIPARTSPAAHHPVALDDSACEWVAGRGIRLVGIDGASIASCSHPMKGHISLLEANVVILEGLDLSRAERGEYELYCLPLKLVGTDGAPARAVLIKKN